MVVLSSLFVIVGGRVVVAVDGCGGLVVDHGYGGWGVAGGGWQRQWVIVCVCVGGGGSCHSGCRWS